MILRVFCVSKLRNTNRESILNSSVDNAFLSSIKGKYQYNYTLKKKKARFVQYIMVLEICIFLIDRDEKYIKR